MCYRAYYAIKKLSTSGGKPTNAVYGFINMFRKIIDKEHPDYLAVAFDMKGPTFRHKISSEYKINRRPMPEELIGQIPVIKDAIRAYNTVLFEKEGFEADDILATIVDKVKSPELEIYIVTADKDMLQLVDDNIFIYNPYNKETSIYERRTVREKFGVEPEAMPDLLALSGDASDNISGIKGIGEKTARELLTEFKSVDGLRNQIAGVKKESLRKTLEDNKEILDLNRRLVVLDCDVPIEVSLDALKIREPQVQKLITLFKELEFKNLLKGLMREAKTDIDIEYRELTGRKEIDSLLSDIRKSGKFAFHFCTSETPDGRFESIGLGIYCGKGVPLFLNLKVFSLKDLACIFEDDSCVKACYDLKSIKPIFESEGISKTKSFFDVMLAAYLIDPSRGNYGLEDISLEYSGVYPESSFMKEGEIKIKACEYSVIIYNLKDKLYKILTEKELITLYNEVELPLVEVLSFMENKGVYFDLDLLKKLSQDLGDGISRLEVSIVKEAGRAFNLDSPKQLREILFNELKLPVIKKGKTGPSTNEEVLTKLSAVHKLPRLILEYRELAKLKSTYVDNIFGLVNRKTGRVHTTFRQAGTETGRLSSVNPNMQNIPVKTDFGRQIRKAISAQGKNILLSADYSQVELRILAHLSGDEALISAFERNLDIHTYTASLIFSVPEKDITSEQRSIAKTVNFGIVYGMSPFGLSKELNIELFEADKFIKAYFRRYPGVKCYIESKIDEASRLGFVTTILNRRRFIPEINSQNQSARQFAERTAVNTPIQGSAADIIKLAMIKVHDKIMSVGIDAFLILQIHDELLFEVSQSALKDLTAIVKLEMEGVVKLKVPLETSLKYGPNWLEMKPVA